MQIVNNFVKSADFSPFPGWPRARFSQCLVCPWHFVF